MNKNYFFFFTFLCLTVSAQNENEFDQSVLWKINGNNLEKPSYLFGTWHLLCRNEMVFKHKVKVAISQSDQLLMQNYRTYLSNEDFFERIKTAEKIFNDTPIYQIEDRKKRKKLLKLIDTNLDLKYNKLKRISYPVKRMTPLEVFFVSMHSFIKDCSGMRSFEQMLFDHFQKNKSRIGAYNDRESFFQNLLKSGFMQVDSLIGYLQDMESQQVMVHEMKKHYYIDEDLEGLKHLYRIFLNNDFVDVTSIDKYIIQIDTKEWVDVMDQWIEIKPTFITINASYLTGELGAVARLRALGYQVEPIK